MQNKPVICLTFDLEEFDLPLEFKRSIDPAEQFSVTRAGMNKLLPLLHKFGVSATFFTTANFATHNADIIRHLCKSHELASHSYYHSSFKREDLKHSREVLEEISGAPVTGFRMPRMLHVDLQALAEAGYRYDSSLHPTWIPGRYNHFRKPVSIHCRHGIIEFPASVTPLWRSPLFWLSFKNVPLLRYSSWVRKCLHRYGYANIYMHPWEFADLSSYQLPGYIAGKKVDMEKRMASFLQSFSGEARFISIQSLLSERNEL